MTRQQSARWTRRGVIGLGLTALALAGAVPGRSQSVLSVPAPELVGDKWLNTPENKPVTLAGRKGKVTIVHFWTFG